MSAIGLVGMFISGATYDANFSTVFRYAWGATIDTEMKDEHTAAQEPLPPYLAKALVIYSASEKKRKEYGERRTSSTAGMQLLQEPNPGQRRGSFITL